MKMPNIEEGQVILITGSKGSGKTATAFSMAENYHNTNTEKKVCTINFPKPNLLPKWTTNAQTLEDSPKDSLLIVDETTLEFNSRESMTDKSKALTKYLATIRHKGQSVIFITQNNKRIDTSILEMTDIQIFKTPSLYQLDNERNGTQKRIKKAADVLKGKNKSFCYVVTTENEGLTRTTLPDWWNEAISKNQSNNTIKETPDKKNTRKQPLPGRVEYGKAIYDFFQPTATKGSARIFQKTRQILMTGLLGGTYAALKRDILP